MPLLVIFQLATVTAWTSGIQVHSEVNGERLQHPRIEDAVDLYGEQALATVPPNPKIKTFLPATSAQPPNSPIAVSYSNLASPELSTNSLYHSNDVEFLPFSPAETPRFLPAFQHQTVQQIYEHAFQTLQPQFQQRFQNLIRQYQKPWNGYGWQQSPWQQGQYQQQLRWQTQYQYPSGQRYPQPVTEWSLGQHQTHQKYYPQNPQSVQYFEDFDRLYSNPAMSNLNAQDLMDKLDQLIEAIKPIDRPLPDNLKFKLFQQAAWLLGQIASLSGKHLLVITIIYHQHSSSHHPKFILNVLSSSNIHHQHSFIIAIATFIITAKAVFP